MNCAYTCGVDLRVHVGRLRLVLLLRDGCRAVIEVRRRLRLVLIGAQSLIIALRLVLLLCDGCRGVLELRRRLNLVGIEGRGLIVGLGVRRLLVGRLRSFLTGRRLLCVAVGLWAVVSLIRSRAQSGTWGSL